MGSRSSILILVALTCTILFIDKFSILEYMSSEHVVQTGLDIPSRGLFTGDGQRDYSGSWVGLQPGTFTLDQLGLLAEDLEDEHLEIPETPWPHIDDLIARSVKKFKVGSRGESGYWESKSDRFVVFTIKIGSSQMAHRMIIHESPEEMSIAYDGIVEGQL